MGVLFFFSMVVALRSAPIDTPNELPFPAAYFKAFMLILPLFYVAPAIWGVCTGVGLLRLKNWARISIIVFGGLLTAFGLCAVLGALVMAVTPIPPTPGLNPSFMLAFRATMFLCALAELGLGIWWLVFFNRAKVKVQFQQQPMFGAVMPQFGGTAPPPNPAFIQPVAPRPVMSPTASRPVSITIIACLLIIGCAFAPVNVALRMPAIFFTLLITGWPAAVYYLAVMAISLYVAIGLLRLWPTARVIGLGYLVFSALNSLVFTFAPGSHERVGKLMEAQSTMFPWMRMSQDNPIKFDPTLAVMIGTVFGLVMVIAGFYFLLASKPAFEVPNRPVAS
jgi:hypothetical protein